MKDLATHCLLLLSLWALCISWELMAHKDADIKQRDRKNWFNKLDISSMHYGSALISGIASQQENSELKSSGVSVVRP